MKHHAIVYDPPTFGGAKAILAALLKLAGLALLLIALLAFPAFSQQVAPLPKRTVTADIISVSRVAPVDTIRMPLLRESDPVAVMGLETKRARRDSVSRQDSIGSQRRDLLAAELDTTRVRGDADATIQFDLGSSKVRADASTTLRETLALLRNVPALRIRIEGRADVRGTTASDITLAWDRAGAAKVWLTNHGMDPDRIDAVGYTEARPPCEVRTDACPSPIQREFLIVAGADVFVRAGP